MNQEKSQNTELPSMLPRLSIRVGIIGNRDLSDCDPGAIEKRLGALLREIQEYMSELRDSLSSDKVNHLYADEAPQLFMVNSLAEGIDQLAANIVVREKLGYQLFCPIPFTVKEYKGFFWRDVDRENFDTIVEQADSTVYLLELCCDSSKDLRNQGYRAAADVLLDNIDVLIAVYDPSRKGKPGGTLESVIEALKRDLPVFHVNSTRPDTEPVRLLASAPMLESGNPRQEGVREILRGILLPEDYRPGQTKQQTTSKKLLRFLRDPRMRMTGIASYTFYVLYCFYSLVWKPLHYLSRRLVYGDLPTESGTGKEKHERTDAEVIAKVQSIRRPYRRVRDRLDDMSTFYMSIYRGSFILNYILGALAVLFALLSYYIRESELFWIYAELICLLLILFTYVANHIAAWHERAMDYRFIAEFFRHMEMLAPIGRTAPIVRTAPYNHVYDPASTWMGWYISAFVRNFGPFGQGLAREQQGRYMVCLDEQYLRHLHACMRNEWLLDQYRYHVQGSKRFHSLLKIFRISMAGLFTVTILAVAIHLIGTIASSSDPGTALAHNSMSVTIVLAAALPAFLAAMHGISVQGEFERLAERSASSALHLKDREAHFRMPQESQTHVGAIQLGDMAVDLARVMLEEVLDWRIIYQGHSVELT